MKVICVNNNSSNMRGEYQKMIYLTIGKCYEVKRISSQNVTKYCIEDDTFETLNVYLGTWYNSDRFKKIEDIRNEKLEKLGI